MHSLTTLVCGHQSRAGTAKIALDQLSTSIDTFANRAVSFLNTAMSDETRAFGPFCARVLLENACAALVGRLDTFRMLYLSEFQAQPEYEPGKRAKSAFSWSGDVMPDDKAAQTLWNIDHDLPKISRALFSKHIEHVYWRPALDSMLDFVSSQPHDPAHADLMNIDSETFMTQVRGRSNQLYSILSKGVHWEFFTSAILFDEATIKSAIRDTCTLTSQLGLASHFIPTAYAKLESNQALAAYSEFKASLT